MAIYTPYPAHNGERKFVEALEKLDDGSLHLWPNIAAPGANEIDALLWQEQTGVFAIEVKAIPLSAIESISLTELRIAERSGTRSAFVQAGDAARALGGYLSNSTTAVTARPFIVGLVAFPMVSRSEFADRFTGMAHCVHSILFREDLESLDTLKVVLEVAYADPLNGLGGKSVPPCNPEILDQFHQAITASSDKRKPFTEDAIPPNGHQVPAPRQTDIERTVACAKRLYRLLTTDAVKYGLSVQAERIRDWGMGLEMQSDRLRVAVVGEFKAGKSTLINALLGREVCFTDEFEATMTTAVYRSGGEESATITYENGVVETVSLQTFLERSRKRDLGKAKFAAITLATNLPVELADTPGLGSRTEAHGSRAEQEVKNSDLIVWAIDSNDAGSARESAFLSRAHELSLPLIPVVTKADAISPTDAEEIVTFLAEETGIPAASFITVSAQRKIKTGADSGMDQLLQKLIEQSDAQKDVKASAARARARETRDAIEQVSGELLERCEEDLRRVEAETNYMNQISESVCKAAVNEWRVQTKAALIKRISDNPPGRHMTDSELRELLEGRLKAAFNEVTPKFFSALSKTLSDRWDLEWANQADALKQKIDEVVRASGAYSADVGHLRDQLEKLHQRKSTVDTILSGKDSQTVSGVALGVGAVATLALGAVWPLAIAALFVGFSWMNNSDRSTSSAALPPTPDYGPVAEELLDRTMPPIQTAIIQVTQDVVRMAVDRIVLKETGLSPNTLIHIEDEIQSILHDISSVREALPSYA